jgi:hypothetical protein
MIFWSFWPLPDHQNIPLGQRLATSPKACAVIRICTTGAARHPRPPPSPLTRESKATVGEHRQGSARLLDQFQVKIDDE